jgi:hypothetical protein
MGLLPDRSSAKLHLSGLSVIGGCGFDTQHSINHGAAFLLSISRSWTSPAVNSRQPPQIAVKPPPHKAAGRFATFILCNWEVHYVLDLWFVRKVKPRCKARAFLCRYADDVVVGFQRRDEAEAFFEAVKERLAQFGLELTSVRLEVE